jgi:hypothetical protein
MFLNVLTSLPIALLITHKSTCKSIQYNTIQFTKKDTDNTIKYRVINIFIYEGEYMKRPLTSVL